MVLFPCSDETTICYKAAEALHRAVWQTDLEKMLHKVDKCEDLKYLPPTVVRNLQLDVLGCDTETILIREEYEFTFKELEKHRPNIGGVVVTGQPGIGTSLLQTNRIDVLIMCRKIGLYLLFTSSSPKRWEASGPAVREIHFCIQSQWR